MIPFLTSLFDHLTTLGQPPPRTRRSDLFANVPVTNQFGKTYHFREDLIRDRAVVINTMFTVCRGSCPGTSEKLQSLRTHLSRLLGKRVSLLSITIDPKQDTPAAMKDYASLYDAGEPAKESECDWHFLTSTPDHIETLRRSLGFYDLNAKIDADITRHASLLLMGNDAADRWATSPAQIREGLIFEPMRRILGTTPQERFGIKPA
jgi:protein SCO1